MLLIDYSISYSRSLFIILNYLKVCNLHRYVSFILLFSLYRTDVHRDGYYHRAVHVWIYAESTQELLIQQRASCKDSWPGLWDISSAGHISAGDSSMISAM